MDEICLALQSILSSALGSYYNAYIYGPEIRVPPKQLFPFVCIVPRGERTNPKGTGGLKMGVYEVDIILYEHIKDYTSASTGITVVSHQQQLVKKMGGRDSNDDYLANTVIGAIYSDLSLNASAHIVSDINVRYDINEYDGSWIAIAVATLSIEKILPNC